MDKLPRERNILNWAKQSQNSPTACLPASWCSWTWILLMGIDSTWFPGYPEQSLGGKAGLHKAKLQPSREAPWLLPLSPEALVWLCLQGQSWTVPAWLLTYLVWDILSLPSECSSHVFLVLDTVLAPMVMFYSYKSIFQGQDPCCIASIQSYILLLGDAKGKLHWAVSLECPPSQLCLR